MSADNIIREALKQFASSSRPGSPQLAYPPSRNSNPASPTSAYLPASQLLSVSQRHCLRLLPAVLQIIKHQVYLTVSAEVPDTAGLFRWDTGLVRDGVFFAGFLAASITDDVLQQEASRRSPISAGIPASSAFNIKQEPHTDMAHDSSPVSVDPTSHAHFMHSQGGVFDVEEGVGICLAAINEMRWAYSKSDEREEKIRMVWHETQLQQHHAVPSGLVVPPGLPHLHSPTGSGHAVPQGVRSFNAPPSPLGAEFPHAPDFGAPQQFSSHPGNHFGNGSHGMLPPPLSIAPIGHRVDSAPSTACSVSSNGSGWPTYTPPGTGQSGTSAGTGVSGGGSPVFAALSGGQVPGEFKALPAPATPAEIEADAFYHVTSDLEHFAFNPQSTGGMYAQRSPITPAHAPASGGYMDFTSTGGDVQFTDDFYHA
jgi:hypothetical protein